MTAQVAANAHRAGDHDPRVARHPGLARATRRASTPSTASTTARHRPRLAFAVRFLDAVAESDAGAVARLERLAREPPPDGVVPVAGGAPDEALRPLDFAPRADGAARRIVAEDVVAAELDRLAAGQQPDGGWTGDFESASPAAALEWRGYATVAAVIALQPET